MDGNELDFAKSDKARAAVSRRSTRAPAGKATGGSSRGLFGGAMSTCHECGNGVGFAEKVSALGETFHKACFTCSRDAGGCGKRLNTSDFCTFDAKDGSEPKLMCKRCYQREHGPRGHGFGGAVGHTTPSTTK